MFQVHFMDFSSHDANSHSSNFWWGKSSWSVPFVMIILLTHIYFDTMRFNRDDRVTCNLKCDERTRCDWFDVFGELQPSNGRIQRTLVAMNWISVYLAHYTHSLHSLWHDELQMNCFIHCFAVTHRMNVDLNLISVVAWVGFTAQGSDEQKSVCKLL